MDYDDDYEDSGFSPIEDLSSTDKGASDRLTEAELLDLNLESLLHPDFVLKQTRSTYGVAGALKDDDEKKEEDVVDASKLVATVLQESRVEHLTAGFMNDSKKAAGPPEDVTARLSRELAAQALSADTYHNLANRRAHLLNTLNNAFEQEYRARKSAQLRKKKFPKDRDVLGQVAVQSTVSVLLRLLRDASRNNPKLCLEILDDLKHVLGQVKGMGFHAPVETKDKAKDDGDAANEPKVLSRVSSLAFDQIHQFLLLIATDSETTTDIRGRCIELLLGLAVARSSLSSFLTVVKLLLFAYPLQHIGALSALHKLESMRREVQMEQPSADNHDMRMSVTELTESSRMSMATDGVYLYTHSPAGLFKIGTGKEGTTPGMVYVSIKGYRSYERSCLAMAGGRLLYRSAEIAPAIFVIIDTQYLLEVGSVLPDGTGTFASADLSHLPLLLSGAKPGKAKPKPKNKASVVAASSEVAEVKELKEVKESKGDKKEGKEEEDEFTKKKKEAMMDPYAKKLAEQKEKDEEKKAHEEEKKAEQGPKPPSAGPGPAPIPSPSGPSDTAPGVDPSQAQAQSPAGPLSPTGAGVPPADADMPLDMDDEEDDKKKKTRKSDGVTFYPMISDGRYVFVVTPQAQATPATDAAATDAAASADSAAASSSSSSTEKKGDKSERSALSVSALDFEGKQRLEHCHSVTLLSSRSKPNSLLTMNNQSSAKQKASRTTRVGRGGRVVATKRASRNAMNMPHVNLGNPEHLNFDGSISVECWFRAPQQAWNSGNYQSLFTHGDPSMRFFVMAYTGSIYAGCNTAMGSGQVNGQVSVDFTEWNHLCVVYDHTSQSWCVYVNGALSAKQRSNIALSSYPGDWILGAAHNNRFEGEIADARIWKKVLTETDIARTMKNEVRPDEEGLMGWWPMSDGFGLTARDLSQYGHPGALSSGCAWISGERPVASVSSDADDDSGASSSVSLPPYRFSKKVLSDAVMYTNGECLAILYPDDVAPSAFPGVDKAVFQAFSLESGELLEECEHEHAASPLAAVLTPAGDALYTAELNQGSAVFHRYFATPPASQSAWRVARFKDDEVADDGVPTAGKLRKDFPLPEQTVVRSGGSKGVEASLQIEDELGDIYLDDDQDEKKTSAKNKANSPSRQGLEGDRVPTATTIATIIARVSNEARFVKHVSTKVPHNLSYLLAVDLNETTFENLLAMLEGLVEEYYAPEPASETEEQLSVRRLRMFAFLTCLNLLRINISHLVGWKVDPAECGLTQDKNEDKDKSMQTRLVALLNKLILNTPTSKLSLVISSKVFEEVSDTLSVGMSVLYGAALSRVRILSELVTGALEAPSDSGVSAQHQLLMSRFFASQSQANNVVIIVPAIITLQDKAVEATKLGRKLRPAILDMANLMERVLSLVMKGARQQIDLCFRGQPEVKDETSVHLRAFLSRASICLIGRAAVPNPSAEALKQVLGHALLVIRSCEQLVTDCVNRLGAPDQTKLGDLAKISDVLRGAVGSLLQPLFSSLWSISIDLKQACEILPSLYRLLAAVDNFASRMPEVISKERSSGDNQRMLVSRSVTVESNHPVRQGANTKVVSIPGVSEMLLDFDPKSFRQLQQGSTINIYRGKNQTDPVSGTLTSAPAGPIKVPGDKVFVVYNCGYNRDWGFKVTAKAFVEEETMDLPWVMDLSKSVALLAGKCASLAIKGEEEQAAEKENNKWLQNELLSEGMDYGAEVSQEECKQLSWLPEALDERTDLKCETQSVVKASEIDLPEAVPAMPKLQRAASYLGMSMITLVRELRERMVKAGVRPDPYPVPRDVIDIVQDAILHVVAVLIKHNKLTTEAQQFINSPEGTQPSSNLVRVYKTPHKLRQWCMQKYQNRRSAAESKANKDKEAAVEDGSLSPTAAASDVKIPDRPTIYKELCDEIVRRSEFLLNVVPAPSPDQSAQAPKLLRTKSSAGSEQEGMTEDEKKAQATLLAWQATRATVPLRYAEPDERFGLVWKHVLQLLDETALNLDSLIESMALRRRRARMRARGLRMLNQLLNCASLSSVKREIVASLVPALSWSNKEAMSGVAPDLMVRLRPAGSALTNEVLESFQAVYRSLIGILKNPVRSGSQLLQAALYAFSLKYSDEEFRLALSLGIFPVLNHLLLTDSTEAKEEVKESKVPESKQPVSGDSDSEHKQVAVDPMSQTKDGLTQPYQTSAFTLLDLLTVLMSKQQQQQGQGSQEQEEEKEPVYDILLSQLDKIADSLRAARQTADSAAGFVPELPSQPTLKMDGSAASTHFDQQVARKVGTVSAFGLQTSTLSAELNDAGAIKSRDAEIYSDSFNIRVLNLVDNVSRLNAGRERVAQHRGLKALFTILQLGSPRSQVVVLRVLRNILTSGSASAPLLKLVDDSVAEKPLATSQPGEAAVEFWMQQIGQRAAAPAFTALAVNKTAMELHGSAAATVLQNLRLFASHSSGGVCAWAEHVSLLRFLSDNSNDWRQVIASVVERSLAQLPSLLQRLKEFAYGSSKQEEKTESKENKDDSWESVQLHAEAQNQANAQKDSELATSSELWSQLWMVLGALNVFGGYVDVLRVGSRVYMPSIESCGVVVARDMQNNTVSVIRDGEGTITEEKCPDVVCLGGRSFKREESFGLVNSAQVFNSIRAILNAVNDRPLTIEQLNKMINDIRNKHDSVGPADGAHEGEEAEEPVDAAEKLRRVEISMAAVTTSMLHTCCIRLLHSLMLSDKDVSAFLQDQETFKKLYGSAMQISPLGETAQARESTEVLEDKLAALSSELTRRARIPADITLTVRHSQPRIRISKPQVDLEAEYANIGNKVSEDSVRASLYYLRLNEEPSAKCTGKIVLIDTYGDLIERLNKLADFAPAAIILALHSATAKLEGLNEDEDDQEDGKKKESDNVIQQAQGLVAGLRHGMLDSGLGAMPMGLSMASRRAGAFSAAAMPGMPASAFSAASTAGSSRKKEVKKKDKDGKEKPATSAALDAVPLICVPPESSRLLRVALGVRSEDNPETVNRAMLVAALVARGYPKEHTLRALEKHDFDLEAAAGWLDTAKEWLYESTAELKEMGFDKESDVKESVALTAEEQVAAIETVWGEFTRNHSSSAQIGPIAATVANTCSPQWLSTLRSQSTFSLLADLQQLERALFIHYARRALASCLLRLPLSQPIRETVFGDRTVLTNTVRACLSMEMFPASELDPLESVRNCANNGALTPSKRLQFRAQLLDMLLQRQAKYGMESTDGAYLPNCLIDEACRLLQDNVKDGSSQSTAPIRVRTHPLEVRSNVATGQPPVEVHVPSFPAMSISIEMDPDSLRNNYECFVTIYSDAACQNEVRQVHVSRMTAGEQIVLGTNRFYLTSYSHHYYAQGPAIKATITMQAMDSGADATSELRELTGDIGSAITLITLAMRSGKRVSLSTLVWLLRSLAVIRQPALAQRACRMAIRLFNRFSWLDEAPRDGDGLTKEQCLAEIKQWLASIENAHAGLRTDLLVNWNSGAMPGSHLQNLLELVLSGRKAVGEEEEEQASAQSESKEDAEVAVTDPKLSKAPEFVVESYKNFRDGQRLGSMINLSQRRLAPDFTLSMSSESMNSGRDMFIGDISVSRGGRWYWDIKLKSLPQQLSLGWCTRDFRTNNYQQLGHDMQGNSWCLLGPNQNYCHRGQYSALDASASVAWTIGTVLGCSVDFEEREIRFYANGKCLGTAFSGINPDESLYPIVMVGRQALLTVNLGREGFEYVPETPVGSGGDSKKKAEETKTKTVTTTSTSSSEQERPRVNIDASGHCAMEDERIASSCWLSRYRHASDVTHMLYQRQELPESVVVKALEKEVSLGAVPMNFEVNSTDIDDLARSPTMSPDNVLVDNDSLFSCDKSTNLHMCFNVVGKDVEVLLQEVQVRLSRNNRGFYGMVFVSQKQPELDSFAWCDNFQQAHFTKFLDRKKATRQPWKPHEPVAFFTSSDTFARVKLDQPRRARFITLKISLTVPRGNIFIERVKFVCIPGSHPLSPMFGTPALETKSKEMKDELTKSALAVSADSNWTLEMDEELVSLVQGMCNKLGVGPISLDAIMLNPGPDDLMRFKTLKDVPVHVLRARFAIIKYLNRLVTPLLHYVDIKMYEKDLGRKVVKSGTKEQEETKEEQKSMAVASFDDTSLSYIVHQLRGLYFMSTKKSVFDALLSVGAASTTAGGFGVGGFQRPSLRITVNRMKAVKSKENRAKDPDGLHSVFGQMYTQLRSNNPGDFRGKKAQQMFQVTFLGEGSIDVGGPYRECIANLSADLMSENTPLFIPCPNRKNAVGLNREKFVINPSCQSATHMAMYEFLGMLMGMALRTGETLNLDLGSIIWKKLIGGSVDTVDLEGVDKLCIQALGGMPSLSQDKFEDLDLKFVTQLSDGQEFELKPKGAELPVKHSDRDEFIRLAINARLSESDQQIRAIRKGLNAVVPANLLSLFSWFDLEMMVCGNPEIDIELLRKHTHFRGFSGSSPLAKNLWKCLESFSTEERQMFLRFVWGRSRLPISENDWTQEFTVHLLKASDSSLPISHTCFFSLELPNYSTYDVLRQKLLYACQNCLAIDIDFQPNQSSLNSWVEND